MLNQKNSKKQGDVGLGRAIGWFAAKGYTVCVPLTDSQEYDLIIETKKGLKKVQVKTTRFKSQYSIFKVGLRIMGGNKSGTGKVQKFNNGHVDFLFVLTSEDERYLIPSRRIRAKNELHLGKEYEKYMVS